MTNFIGKNTWTRCVLFALVFLMIAIYIYSFRNLNTNLRSINDEGFFYTLVTNMDKAQVGVSPLSLAHLMISAWLPDSSTIDLLYLRHAAFVVFCIGLLFFLLSSCFYLLKKYKNIDSNGILFLILMVLSLGVVMMPNVAVNFNDISAFCELLIISFLLLLESINHKGAQYLIMYVIGILMVAFSFAMPPGGLLVSFATVVYFFLKRKNFKFFFIPVVLGSITCLIYANYKWMSLSELYAWLVSATGTVVIQNTIADHSLKRVVLVALFGCRQLFITISLLLGVTYISNFLDTISIFKTRKWISFVLFLVLVVVVYKSQRSPDMLIASLGAWSCCLYCVGEKRERDDCNLDYWLIIYLLLMPFLSAFGTNTVWPWKAQVVYILPWSLMLFLLYKSTLDNKMKYSIYILLFVIIVPASIRLFPPNTDHSFVFKQEKPIARMKLNKNQFVYYNTVYSLLQRYNYKAQKDSLLGFGMDEMTVVAMDAIPYTIDQLSNEFLKSNEAMLPAPSFMILRDYDLRVLPALLSKQPWGFPYAYDKFLLNSPDLHTEEEDFRYLYCRKNRKL